MLQIKIKKAVSKNRGTRDTEESGTQDIEYKGTQNIEYNDIQNIEHKETQDTENNKTLPAGSTAVQKDNTLRHLSRAQLLEMLYEVVQEKENLEKELAETRKKLADKEIRIQESGSLAEAALKLNGIFEQAQASIDQYRLNMQERTEKQAAEIIAQAESDAGKILKDAQREAADIREKTEKKV
ncbi:MAG: hypothetical protein ACI4ET_05935 [Bilifractor sp.]